MNEVSNQRLQAEQVPSVPDMVQFGLPLDCVFRQGSALPVEIIERLSRMPSEPLVRSSAWREFAQTAEALPVPVYTLFVECRLAEANDRTDFGLGLFPGSEIARWTHQLGTLGEHGPEWQRIASFLHAWSSPGSPHWSKDVPFLFLAFDSDISASARPAPCLSLCVDPDFFARHDGKQVPPLDAERVLEVVRRSHLDLAGVQLPEAASERLLSLARCEGIELRHVSFMLSRPSAPVKLDLRLPLSQLGQYLQQQLWPHATAVATTLAELSPFGDYLQLNLPLEPYPARRLEIEVLAGRVQVTREERFQFLARLVERGVAASDKVQVLRSLHQRPLVELAANTLLGANFYVKLCFEEGDLVESKVYLGFMPKILPTLMGSFPG